MKNLTIIQRVLIALAVPMLALLILSTVILVDLSKRNASLGVADSLTTTLPEIASLAHALQVERGTSAGFIGSGRSDEFRKSLDAARADTDIQIEKYLRSEALIPKEQMPKHTISLYNEMHSKVIQVSQLRENVDSKWVVPETVKAYTESIELLFALVNDIHKMLSTAHLADDMNAIHEMMVIIENSGLERATGAVGFAAGEFETARFLKFVELGNKQTAEFEVLVALANPEIKEALKEYSKGPEFKQVEDYRNLVKNSLGTNLQDPPTGREWFEAASARIAKLIELEKLSIHAFEVDLEAEHQKLNQLMYIDSALICAMITLTLIAGWFSARSITVPVKQLREDVEKLAHGEKADVRNAQQKSEIGHLARSVLKINDLLFSSRKTAAALDAGSTAMILDEDLRITYVNSKLNEKILKSKEYLSGRLKDGSDLTGNKITDFLENGNELLGRIQSKEENFELGLTFDKRYFLANVAPINYDGQLVGYAIEMQEQTVRKALEEQVSNVIDKARSGDFSNRVEINSSNPFLMSLKENVNAICEAVEEFTDDMQECLSAAANGDLTKKVDDKYTGQLGELAKDANTTISKLGEIVGDMKKNSGEIKFQSDSVSGSSKSLSDKANNQAATLEETAAAMQSVADRSRLTGQRVSEAHETAADAGTKAQQGRQFVETAIDSVSKIKQSTEKISEFSGLINEIAFQTNLLALNAAVEAARAGEEGKGFAVVASEVRSLAQRSSEASESIGAVIKESVYQVEEGVASVSNTGETIGALLDAVQDVASKMGDIDGIVNNQNQGILEVNEALTLLDEITQSNAKDAEVTASGAALLAKASEKLDASTQQFTTASSPKVAQGSSKAA